MREQQMLTEGIKIHLENGENWYHHGVIVRVCKELHLKAPCVLPHNATGCK